MARRARKGVGTTQIALIAVVVAALAAMIFFIANRSKDKFSGLSDLPVAEYMRNANSLRGSVFKMSGTISGKPRYTENNGQIILVEVDTPSGIYDLAVYVPVELYGTNLDRGDPITSRVEVRTGGVLALQEIR